MPSPLATIDDTDRSRAASDTIIRQAVIWRSAGQVIAQLLQWTATVFVIRILDPHDYGVFAMGQVVLTFLALANGYDMANAVIRAPIVRDHDIRQLFALLILLNGAIAGLQVALAPVVAAYYGEPMVATLLRVQALLYLATPFIVLPQALLSRRMEFRRQARANVAAAAASAATALGTALAGWGVWTLVAAPAMLYLVRAVLLCRSAGALVRPLFDFRGAGALIRYGAMMAAAHVGWFIQSQADIVIAGPRLSAHMLGLYTTALFLAQILAARLVSPLNEVAFSVYARIADDRPAMASAFVGGARTIMVAAMPFHLGLAAVAEPLVTTILGDKWSEAAPIVRLLALAMPFMTLQMLLNPASDAMGRPGIGIRNAATGAAILAMGFLVGSHWGAIGLAGSWLVAYPIYLCVSLRRTLPAIGVDAFVLVRAVMPPVAAAVAMALVVSALDAALPLLASPVRLALLVPAGMVVYAGWLWLFAPALVGDLVTMARGR